MAQVELFIEGRTARVHLNRPDARNALTFGMDVLLSRFWRQVDEDPEIWTVVLTAQGDEAFCIGADMSEARPAAPRLAVGGGLTGIGGPLVPLSKPLVAAVQGFCVGAGFELAMCADVIVAAENAQFGLPETRRGIIGECGVVHRAVRRLPHHVAMAMILTGERIDARAAERFGLVNQLVPLAGLSDAAMDWAARINKASRWRTGPPRPPLQRACPPARGGAGQPLRGDRELRGQRRRARARRRYRARAYACLDWSLICWGKREIPDWRFTRGA
ncbi:enoyl-CoA hydratase/isomerase family protein [Novosphingobium resinovorum]